MPSGFHKLYNKLFHRHKTPKPTPSPPPNHIHPTSLGNQPVQTDLADVRPGEQNPIAPQEEAHPTPPGYQPAQTDPADTLPEEQDPIAPQEEVHSSPPGNQLAQPDQADVRSEEQDPIAPQEDGRPKDADRAHHEPDPDAEQSDQSSASIGDNASGEPYSLTTQRVKSTQRHPAAVSRAVPHTPSGTLLASSTTPAPGWRGKAYEGFKTSLDTLVEVSGVFPPLKAAAGGLRSVLTIVDVRTPSLQIVARKC